MKEIILKRLKEKEEIIQSLYNSDYLNYLEEAIDIIVNSLKSGHKVLLAGNGGSAADAQHFAGEMMGRFLMERKGLPAVSLCTDPSVATCIANDYGFENIFKRQVEALGNGGDVLIVISTSGNSVNLLNSMQAAKDCGIVTVALLGKNGGKMKEKADCALIVPSNDTPRIQEIHIFTIHIICEILEKRMFSE